VASARMASPAQQGKGPAVSNVLPLSARVRVANQLVEGTSIRATVRLTGVAKATVMRFGVTLGEGCVRLHDRLVRNVAPVEIQMNEIWGFVAQEGGAGRPCDRSRGVGGRLHVGRPRSAQQACDRGANPRRAAPSGSVPSWAANRA
jgi:hypothetical protein